MSACTIIEYNILTKENFYFYFVESNQTNYAVNGLESGVDNIRQAISNGTQKLQVFQVNVVMIHKEVTHNF